ncbi:MAG: hypothetical protein PHP82_04010 [Candidatus ainarchaeum sp.]|nr:hypothetical protein [Candidatus ainarchaeum sp.]
MNKKGIMTILISISIFIVSITMLSGNYYYNERIDFSQQIIEAKIKITNYEMVLNQSIQDCNWDKPKTEILNCIQENSIELEEKIFENSNLNCNNVNYNLIGNTASGMIICNKTINIKETVFIMDLNKNIILEKHE